VRLGTAEQQSWAYTKSLDAALFSPTARPKKAALGRPVVAPDPCSGGVLTSMALLNIDNQ
jgi:hypothetical protein